MQTSKTIVASTRTKRPIFEIADYGVVGDPFKVAPQLTEAIMARKAFCASSRKDFTRRGVALAPRL